MVLISKPSMDDENLKGSVILITERNEEGAMGFVFNKLFHRSLNELAAFSYSRPFPLYDGGPVDKEHLFFVHRRPDLIEEGRHVVDSIYLGGNFRQAIARINDKTLSESDIRIFIGYCGWDRGQLEAEIEEGSWSVVDYSEITW